MTSDIRVCYQHLNRKYFSLKVVELLSNDQCSFRREPCTQQLWAPPALCTLFQAFLNSTVNAAPVSTRILTGISSIFPLRSKPCLEHIQFVGTITVVCESVSLRWSSHTRLTAPIMGCSSPCFLFVVGLLGEVQLLAACPWPLQFQHLNGWHLDLGCGERTVATWPLSDPVLTRLEWGMRSQRWS